MRYFEKWWHARIEAQAREASGATTEPERERPRATGRLSQIVAMALTIGSFGGGPVGGFGSGRRKW